MRIHLYGAIVAAAFSGLAVISRASAQVNVWWVLALMLVAWGGMLFGWRALTQTSSQATMLRAIWLWAVALRAIGLVGEPILEDDFFRYLWDGRQFATTGDPYATAPSAHFNDAAVPDAFQTILNNINNPGVQTVYGPVCEYVFLLSYRIAPGELWPIKLILMAADLATLALLLRLTKPRNALLYAWCPLLIFETAFNAHPDSLGIFFAVAALGAMQGQRWWLVALLTGVAAATRIHVLLLLPLLLWRAGWRNWIASVFWAAVCYLPFWSRGSVADLRGLGEFFARWEFNSSVFAIISAVTSWAWAKRICAAAFVAFFGVYFLRWKRTGGTPRGDLVYGMFFLFSAVINPWYALWLLPFVAMFPSATGITALAAVTLSYLHGANLGWDGLGVYDHPKWLRPLEYGLILTTAFAEWRRNLLTAKRKTG